jgi:hypothetical protein
MSVINTATKLYVGSNLAAKAYSGANQVWPAVAALDPATTAWIAAVGSANVSAGRRTIVDNLVKGLKTDGLWTKLNVLHLFAAENYASANVDLVGLLVATTTANLLANGYYCNHSTEYVTTAFNFSSGGGGKFTQNSAHVGVWNLTDGGTTYFIVLPSTGLGAWPHIQVYTDNNCYARINDSAGGGVAMPDCKGFLVGNRSDATTRQTYRNGVSLGTTTAASEVPANGTMVVFDKYIAAVCAGASLNATEQTNYYNRMRTYMTAVGVP